jgi:putative transposase
LDELQRARYLRPLQEIGPFGDQVVEALRSYLRHERSIPLTATALRVHVNTLRYRLSRFEELTGRSLQHTDTVVELALALGLATAD